jgi:hypothetical protein
MVGSLLFYLTICWLVPFIPMMMSLILGWEQQTFLEIWLVGTPFFVVALIVLYMKRKAK